LRNRNEERDRKSFCRRERSEARLEEGLKEDEKCRKEEKRPEKNELREKTVIQELNNYRA